MVQKGGRSRWADGGDLTPVQYDNESEEDEEEYVSRKVGKYQIEPLE